jgi:glycosyltransferase involved in cell wall biosynthesis
MVKVLHLASGTDYGGAKTHIFTLLPELTKHIEVTLGCFSAGPFLDEAEALGLDVHALRQVTRYDLGAVGRLEALVRERDYDLIHCHGPRPNVLAILARRRLARPLVTTVHSDYRKDFAGEPLRHLVFTKLNAWALRRFDRYLVGLGVEESVLQLGVPRRLITSLKNGLVFDRPPAPPRDTVLASLGLSLPPGSVIVGIVARLHPVKCHEVFLAGAAAVARDHPAARFLIVGDGPIRPALERLASRLGTADKVHFLGHIAEPESVFSILDVNTLTSFSETQPYALLEGARRGVATLSSRVGGIPELIIDGKTGCLFEPGDVEGFARHLGRLVADPELRRRLGAKLYEHGRKNFTPAVMAETCLSVYRELVRLP